MSLMPDCPRCGSEMAVHDGGDNATSYYCCPKCANPDPRTFTLEEVRSLCVFTDDTADVCIVCGARWPCDANDLEWHCSGCSYAELCLLHGTEVQ